MHPLLIALLLFLTSLFALPVGAAAQITQSGAELISKVPAGVDFNGMVGMPALPPNSGLIFFASNQAGIVPGADGERMRVYRRAAGKLELVSKSAGGTFPNSDADQPAVTQVLQDGGYAVAFRSSATDIISGYISPSGVGANPAQVYLRLEPSGRTILLSQGINPSTGLRDPKRGADNESSTPQVALIPGIMPVVVFAFLSKANNIVNGYTGATSVPFFGQVGIGTSDLEVEFKAPLSPRPDEDCFGLFLSGNGSSLAFSSRARNLLSPIRSCPVSQCSEQAYVYDQTRKDFGLLSGSVEKLDKPSDGDNILPSLSFDATVAAFVTNAKEFGGASNRGIVVARDKTSKRVANLSLAADGTTQSNGGALDARISPNGLYVVFTDNGTNLVPGLSNPNAFGQVFVKHRLTGAIALLSQSAGGSVGDAASRAPAIGALGFNSLDAVSAFSSSASNLDGPPLASQSSSRIFRNEILVPVPPVANNLPITVPPDVKVVNRSISLKLQIFKNPGQSARTLEAETAATRVRYSIEINKTTGRRERILRTTTRNQVTIRRLSPGRYTVRYRVSGRSSSGKNVQTRFSPKQPFVLS